MMQLRNVIKKNKKMICLLIIAAVIILGVIFGVQCGNYVKIILKYEPTGTTQAKAMLSYEYNGDINTIIEPVENFSTVFEIRNEFEKLEDISVIIGDHSGTVKIERIKIETRNKK